MSILEGYLMPHPPVIIPEVGQERANECQATLDALDKVGKRVEVLKPETIVIISPHGPVFSDGLAISSNEILSGSLAAFGSPEVSFNRKNNCNLVDKIVMSAGLEGIVVAKVDNEFAEEHGISKDVDHGALVPLYFIDKYYQDYKIVHITYGLLSRPQLYKFGMCLQNSIDQINEDVIIIASGDLSHRLKDSGPYDYNVAGPKFDKEIIGYLENGDFLNMLRMETKFVADAGECGYRSLNILAGAFDGYTTKGAKLSYEGPFGVGYAVVQFKPSAENIAVSLYDLIDDHRKSVLKNIKSKEDLYVKLAREAIGNYVLNKEHLMISDDLPREMLDETSGVFVSIKSNGGLRGCIGTIAPTTSSIAKEIVANAIKASTEDPRFEAIEAHELDDLIISVDILKPAEKISSQNELDPKRYGVIVTSDYKRGLLLPNLDGVETVEEQMGIVLRKAGIGSNESYEMERFEVIRHK